MFTKKEQLILEKLQQNPGEIRFFKDIAEHFIKHSQLEISTFSQLAYVNLSASHSSTNNVINAQSEYFEVLVFIQKLEKSELIFHIPFTALADNTAKIGPSPENAVHKTIADADLLIQLFQFAGKKYIFTPGMKNVGVESKPGAKPDFFKIAILLLLVLFIGFVGYHAHLERKQLQSEQKEIGQLIENNEKLSYKLEENLSTISQSINTKFQEVENTNSTFNNDLKIIQTNLKDARSSQRSQYYYLTVINKKVDSLNLKVDNKE